MSQVKNTADKYYVWNINGQSFEFDVQDVANSRRYEEAFEIMEKEEKELPKDGKNSDRILAYCLMFRHLFDNILGEGSADRIFGSTNNSRIMNEVYESFLTFISGQSTAIQESQNRIFSKFSPNRAQRRASK